MRFDAVTLIVAFAAGCLVGLGYFGLLWWTVRRIPTARRPGLLLVGSLVGRLAASLTAFYVVMDGRWECLFACLAGFLVVRQVMIGRLRPSRGVGNGNRTEVPA